MKRRPGRPRLTHRDFWAKVERGDLHECWLWKGARWLDEYGLCSATWLEGSRRQNYAHQVAWALANGDVLPPKGFVVHHICETKLCVNPLHLELLTASEHMKFHWGLV